MRAVHLVVAGVLGLALVLSAGAQDKDKKPAPGKEKIEGVWKPAKGKDAATTTLEFAKGGKFRVTNQQGDKKETFEGTWKREGTDKLKITLKVMDKERTHTLTIEKLTKDELVTKDSKGKSDTFKRVK
jgi:uncharacterized protein (TIGR03066 family)